MGIQFVRFVAASVPGKQSVAELTDEVLLQNLVRLSCVVRAEILEYDLSNNFHINDCSNRR